MVQEIIVWIIVAACAAVAVIALIRRLCGRGKACDCGCTGKACGGCPHSM